MINTISKTDKKDQSSLILENLLNESFLFSKWEKIKDIIVERKSLFSRKQLSIGLFRKFSTKNNVEKYVLKDDKGNIAAGMDLRVYKDSVYIININAGVNSDFEQIFYPLFQIAAEKTLYNTTDKILKINLSFPIALKNKIKKFITNKDFCKEEYQSKYEQEMFGETYSMNIELSSFWQKRIKNSPILINC